MQVVDSVFLAPMLQRLSLYTSPVKPRKAVISAGMPKSRPWAVSGRLHKCLIQITCQPAVSCILIWGHLSRLRVCHPWTLDAYGTSVSRTLRAAKPCKSAILPICPASMTGMAELFQTSAFVYNDDTDGGWATVRVKRDSEWAGFSHTQLAHPTVLPMCA